MFEDFKFAARSLLRKPTSTAVLVATLATGLAGSASSFAVLDASLYRVLPTEHPEEMVRVTQVDLQTGKRSDASPADFSDWKAATDSIAAIALLSRQQFTFTFRGSYPELVSGMLVSEDFFRAFGRAALKGRTFLPDDFKPGSRTLVVSYSFWKTRLGQSEDFGAASIKLNGEGFRVVGVMPEDFNFTRLPGSQERCEFWAPRDLQKEVRQYRRSARIFPVIARLRPGASPERGEAELRSVAQGAPGESRGEAALRVQLVSLREALAEGARVSLLLLFGAFAFFWLVCVVNVANLMLAKTIAREEEMAIRCAMGATRWTLARLLSIEALQICAVSAAVAAILAAWSLRLVNLFGVGPWAELPQSKVDDRTFLFLGFAAAVSSLLCAGFSIFRSWRHFRSLQTLASRSASVSRDRRRMANLLVVAEVALATVLSAGAGLMLNSFVHLNRVDLGFDPDKVLAFHLAFPSARYSTPQSRQELVDRVLEAVGATSGVEKVASGHHPLSGAVNHSLNPQDTQEAVDVKLLTISPDYFRVLGIRLLGGRAFDGGDRDDSPPVAVVSAALAEELWPGQDPIGKTVTLSGDNEPARRVVGLVGSVRRSGPEGEPSIDLYLPRRQFARVISTSILVKAERGSGDDLVGQLRSAMASLDDQLAAERVAWLDETLSDTWREKRTIGVLLTGLALLSLGLAALGLYSVVSAHVTLRRSEIGVRMALGADPSRVFRWVVLKGMGTLAFGLATGLFLAFLLSGFLARFLFQVSPIDPTSLGLVAGAVSAAALAACALPAWRASRVDPMAVLRSE